MTRIWRVFLVAMVVVSAASCGADNSVSNESGEAAVPRGAQGQESGAGDFTVETFEGDTFSLSEQRGTPVVLNFWESW